jgi:hypothetical protein
MLVAVEGPSASGKTRAVEGAADRFGVIAIAEAFDRLRPRPDLRWRTPAGLLRLERRLLREDARRYREARRLTRTGATVLADTGFLGSLTYTRGLVHRGHAPPRVLTALLSTARALEVRGDWGLPDAYLYLRTPALERRRRARRDIHGHPEALQDRHQEIAREELSFYRAAVIPRFGPRFRFVSGAGDRSTVLGRLGRAVRRLASSRSQRPSLDRILEAVEDLASVA